MSANIPSTMPMSDLLKSTGYNCPTELQGKTFDEATSGGDTKISTNTAATIDVSTYTEPVEIEPAEGYDATKKATVTLTNIPSGGTTLYSWLAEGQNQWEYYPFAVAPTDLTEYNSSPTVYIGGNAIQIEPSQSAYSYTKVSDTEYTVVFAEGGESYTYTRDTAGDVTLW